MKIKHLLLSIMLALSFFSVAATAGEHTATAQKFMTQEELIAQEKACLLYTSDAADE